MKKLLAVVLHELIQLARSEAGELQSVRRKRQLLAAGGGAVPPSPVKVPAAWPRPSATLYRLPTVHPPVGPGVDVSRRAALPSFGSRSENASIAPVRAEWESRKDGLEGGLI